MAYCRECYALGYNNNTVHSNLHKDPEINPTPTEVAVPAYAKKI